MDSAAGAAEANVDVWWVEQKQILGIQPLLPNQWPVSLRFVLVMIGDPDSGVLTLALEA